MRVAVVGGGVVGAAVTLALARRSLTVTLLEAGSMLATAASGSNSGILHTGFDAIPGELETRLIHRSVRLREQVLDALDVPVLRCGAEMRAAPPAVIGTAKANGVPVSVGSEGTLGVAGEWVTDPVALTAALASAAERAGARRRVDFRVVAVEGDLLRSETGGGERFDLVCNCAGLHADDVARLFGDESFAIYPRKGEFLVFDVPLGRILLPVPSARTKGVLVFPTVHGGCICGPTAIDLEDKQDWSVRDTARAEIMGKAMRLLPALEGAEPIDSYAGLRPAGRDTNYVIGRSVADRRLFNVAAIRSTGVSAALGIAEHVADLVAPGVDERPLSPGITVRSEIPLVAPRGGVASVTDRPLLLGIDDGTSAVKVIAYDLDLRPVAGATRPVSIRHPRPGWVEQDPEEVLAAVVDGVTSVLDEVDGMVVACGIDHQGESVLAWDAESGRPRSPILVWQDKRAEALLAALGDRHAADVVRLSGLPLDPYFSAASLAWLVTDGGLGDLDGIRLGTVDAFLSDRLGAGHATDLSTASRTQLSGVMGDGVAGWDGRLLAVFDVPPGFLPVIRDSAGELGVLRHPRWRQDLPLRARLVDQQAALAGSGCVRPGQVKATFGTGVFVLAHVGETRPERTTSAGLLPTVAWRIAGRTEYALDGGVFTAGALMGWLSHDLGLASDPSQLMDLARSVPDAAGVRILPALTGLGAPWWRSDVRGIIAGLGLHTTRAHIARAAVEAVTWRVADIMASVGRVLPVASLRVDGGGSADPLVGRLLADATGATIERLDADATCAGAAGLAAVGAGIWSSTDEIASRVRPLERIEPHLAAATRAVDHAAWIRFVERALAAPD